jgi:hypothetical protein
MWTTTATTIWSTQPPTAVDNDDDGDEMRTAKTLRTSTRREDHDDEDATITLKKAVATTATINTEVQGECPLR